MAANRCRLAIIGGLRRDFFITADGKAHVGIPGGHGLYAAVGARIWAAEAALYSRIAPGVPEDILAQVDRAAIHRFGPARVLERIEQRRFFAYVTVDHRVGGNPAGHFLRVGSPLPKELLDYPLPATEEAARIPGGPDAYLPDDLPREGDLPEFAHICPADYRTGVLLPQRLREAGASLVTLDPLVWYEGKDYPSAVGDMVLGLDAFLPSAEEAREVFRPRDLSPFEMAEALTALGCRFVGIKYGAGGSCVWDRDRRRGWHVPAYPARVRDITGAGDAYCGGFLAGLAERGDPLEAALMGTVSASLAVEGSCAFYPLDVLPGLALARLDAVRRLVRPA